MDELHLDFTSPHKKSALNFSVREYLLLGGGPTNCSDRVRKVLATQCLNPMSTDTFQVMDEVKVFLRYVFQTKNNLTIAVQTSGNGGNETILTNLLDPGDKLVVAVGGTWGEKVVDMAERHSKCVFVLAAL
jgi:alanine-glyoxylate transaminase/serine-glyoxylate transaminase/serine-pyruvate transaminase